MSGILVRRAVPADIGPLAGVLARAYADDPLLGWFVQGRHRARRLERFFRATISPMITRGLREVVTNDAREGVAFWAAPGTCSLPVLPMLRSVPTALAAARSGIVRSARAVRALQSGHPRDPHWYLETIATDPAAQGKGVATALMQPFLERCDAGALAAYLETQRAENVGFYARRGFAVVGELDMPAGGPHMWLMQR